MTEDENRRGRALREARLKELGLSADETGPRCFHCQILLTEPYKYTDLLCAACDSD